MVGADLSPYRVPEGAASLLHDTMPFYVVDRAGTLVYANREYTRLCDTLGTGGGLLPGVELSEIILELEAGGVPVQREIALGGAAPVRLLMRHAALAGAGGELAAVAGSVVEIDERAAVNPRLADLEERLDDLTRLVSDWVWETDAGHVLTFVSPRVDEALGRHPRELVGHAFAEIGRFVGEEGAEDGGHVALPLGRRRTPFRDLSFEARHRDGSPRLFRVSGLPVFCPRTGEFKGFRGTARDVTGEAEAARRAAQSQARLTEAVESISEGFALFDAEDRLVLCNSKFRSISPRTDTTLGRRFEDILRDGVAHGDVLPPGPDVEGWIAERLAARRQPRAAFEMQLGDGRWIQANDRKTADGSVVGVRTDITELKRREEALYHAKEMAEIASRSKSEFLANISHELRTPLNAIIGFSEVMREGIFGPIGGEQYQEYLGDILDSANHLLEVINDILDIAKAEAGKLELASENIDVARVIRAAARLVRERAHRGELTLDLALPTNLPTVFADERKLKQILLNLLTNAVKFTPKGGRLTITAGLDEAGDLLIGVADTGIGIAPENIETALAPFGQVDGSLNRKYEGTGLGLPLSRAMAQLHGGDLAIESEIGHGTKVTVRLPAERVQRQSSAA